MGWTKFPLYELGQQERGKGCIRNKYDIGTTIAGVSPIVRGFILLDKPFEGLHITYLYELYILNRAQHTAHNAHWKLYTFSGF